MAEGFDKALFSGLMEVASGNDSVAAARFDLFGEFARKFSAIPSAETGRFLDQRPAGSDVSGHASTDERPSAEDGSGS